MNPFLLISTLLSACFDPASRMWGRSGSTGRDRSLSSADYASDKNGCIRRVFRDAKGVITRTGKALSRRDIHRKKTAVLRGSENRQKFCGGKPKGLWLPSCADLRAARRQAEAIRQAASA